MLKKILEVVTEGKEIILVSLLFLGAAVLLDGVYDFDQIKGLEQLKDPTSWKELSQVSISLTSIGVLLIISSVSTALLTKEKSKQKLPNIAGHWHYHVRDGANKSSHTGKCIVSVSTGRVKFDGIRRFVVEVTNGNHSVKEVNWPWETTWVDYCDDGLLRSEYTFRSFNGYFKVRFADRQVAEHQFSGTYYLLPDSFEDSRPPPNAMYGTVEYKRVHKDQYDNVSPPAV